MSATKSRSDLAVSKMGELLLKGYRMLDATCEICDTVIMQDQKGEEICVLCKLDGHKVLDNKLDTSQHQITSTLGKTPAVATVKKEAFNDNNGNRNEHQRVFEDVIIDLLDEMKGASTHLAHLPNYGSRSEAEWIKGREALQQIKTCVELIKDLQQIRK